MRSTAEFQIMGRIGRIAEVGTTFKNNIASDYPREDGNGYWNENTHWNTVTVFAERMITWIKENTKSGDLVYGVAASATAPTRSISIRSTSLISVPESSCYSQASAEGRRRWRRLT